MNHRQERITGPTLINNTIDNADIVIIGNGIAGLTAAVEARQLAPDKRIAMITDQIHPTINTPALKQFAMARLNREQLLAYPAGTERAHGIQMITAHVEEINAHHKHLRLSGGYSFGYHKLLIATGSAPQGLPVDLPGRDFDGVMTLHRLQDYLNLRRRISEVAEAVVIGGGAHAIETVMGLRHWGIHVHWLIRGATFMRNTLDAYASAMVLSYIRRGGGISIYTDCEVAGIVGRVGVVVGVITNQQKLISCQLVLSCTGTRSVTTLARHCTAPIMQQCGIVVDDMLRTNVYDIYAAGDAAAVRNPQTGQFAPRAQWYAAVQQGRIAGAVLTEHQPAAAHTFGVHWHATHLGPLSMLTVGEPLSNDPRISTLTDSGHRCYRRMTLRDNRLVGYLSLGDTQPDSLAIKKIIDEGHPVQDITRALLKGRFDAQRYLAQTREKIITTGKLSPRETVQLSMDAPPTNRRQASNQPVTPDSALAAMSAGNRYNAISLDSPSGFLNRPGNGDLFSETPLNAAHVAREKRKGLLSSYNGLDNDWSYSVDK
jgi:NAD(P)H-nitrite reductase large subunit